MTRTEPATDGIQGYLRQLTPQARARLLAEVERLRICGDRTPGMHAMLADLRKEFGKETQSPDRLDTAARHFFQPLEPFLLGRAPEQARDGRISRASLTSIWDLIRNDLMQSAATAFADEIKRFVAGNKQHEAAQATRTFQSKALKYLEGVLASAHGTEQTRARLAFYTSLRGTFGDLLKMLCVLKARDALAEFDKGLPAKIGDFVGGPFDKTRTALDALAARHGDALPFALTLVARRLKSPWQLIRLATKTVESKDAAEIAAAPYAVSVTMVLDQVDEKVAALRDDLRTKRAPLAKDILRQIYDMEYALRVRIDLTDASEWGRRLDAAMKAVSDLLSGEQQTLPGGLQHVLGSRALKRHDSVLGQLTWLAWKCRDALTDGAAYCRQLVWSPQKSHR